MQNLMPPIDTTDHAFHDGDPTTGQLGTIVTAAWLNDVQGATRDIQAEIIAVLTKAGMQPNPQKQNQLAEAISQIIGSGGYATSGDLTLGLSKKIDKADIAQQLGNDTTKVPSLQLVTTELGKKASVADANSKLAKDKNGADIPDKEAFIGNLGLPELLNLKRDKTDNIFPAVTFKPEGSEDVLWLAYDEQKKQFSIAFNTGGVAKYVYLQNKAGSFALEEQVTAQAILTKLLQVDGSGSELDADLVRGLPADFGSSSSTNGYQKLPSGMIIQWGVSGQSPTDIYVKFPVAFTRPPLFIGESTAGGRYTTSVWTANEITNVGFNATQVCTLNNTSDKVNPPGNYATNWLAIGF